MIKILEFLCGWNEWLWGFLPDNCERPYCPRKGVRGNENIAKDGAVECDYCSCRELISRDQWLKGYFSAVYMIHGQKPFGMEETGLDNYETFGKMELNDIHNIMWYQEQKHKVSRNTLRPEAFRVRHYLKDLEENDHFFPTIEGQT